MSLRRSLLDLRIQTNYFSLSKRSISSLLKKHEFTQKLDPMAVSRIDKRPISLSFRVSSLIELSQLYQAAQISRLAVFENNLSLNLENMIGSEIIGALCAAKSYDDAIALYQFFDSDSKVSVTAVSFNHIIKAYCDENHLDEALKQCNPYKSYFRKDVDTLRLLTKGLIHNGRIHEALGFTRYVRIWDSVVYSYIIRGFLDQGNHDKAYDLFDEFNHKSRPGGNKGRSVVDVTFVDYWLKQGMDKKAMEIYRSVMSRNRKGEEVVCVATGNTFLKILFDNGKQAEAWDLFKAMITNPKTFDRETFGTMVNACFKLGHFKEALETFKRPELTRSSRCYANIIAKFCDRGMMSEAQDLFAEMCSDQYLCPDVSTFRSMINGYAMVGRVDDSIEMLKKMVDATLLKVAVHEAS